MSAAPPPSTVSNQRVDFLDVARGFAILTVFCFHCIRSAHGYKPVFAWGDLFLQVPLDGRLLGLPLTYGSCGVAVFFVISGFCIHISYTRKPDPWFRQFSVRRVLRILPPYLVALLVFAFVYPFATIDFDRPRDVTNLLAHVFLIHNLFPLDIYAGINASFWSVAVEAQLYLLYPLMFLCARRFGWQRTLVFCACIEIPIRLVMAGGILLDADLPRWFSCSPLTFVLSWSIGAAIAEAWQRREKLPFAGHSFWFWLAMVIVSYHVAPMFAYTFLLAALATATFVSRSLSGDQLIPAFPGREWIGRHLAFAGTISYSLYLIHQPLLDRVVPVVSRLAGIDFSQSPGIATALNLASWPLLLIPAWLMYQLLELPSVAMARKLVVRSPRSAERATKVDTVLAGQPRGLALCLRGSAEQGWELVPVANGKHERFIRGRGI